MKRISSIAWGLLVLAMWSVASTGRGAEQGVRWYSVDANKKVTLHVYVFYSQRCSHCQDALRFLDDLEKRHPWLHVTRYETTMYPQNRAHYQAMAQSIGRVAGQVPAFFYCKQLEIGYDSYALTGKRLEASMLRCWEHLAAQVKKASGQSVLEAPGVLPLSLLALTNVEVPPEPANPTEWDLKMPTETEALVHVPLLGDVHAKEISLPLLTVVIAGCDAFNPCAFFVLLFLLSLMVHAHSRWQMAMVGGIFVLASGVIYFLFMAAWLNLFFVMGHVQAITIAAGLLAILIALVNIKDFFWFKKGPSLTIPDTARPGLFQRMTRLVSEKKLGAMLVGTSALAVITNLYELLCTSGFPMIYTRILTLRELSPAEYYLYLFAYNVVYVLPLLIIVTGFTVTLGSRKLSEEQGRILKLLSGVMMLFLGGLLVLAPQWLSSVVGAISLLILSVGVTATIVCLSRRLGVGPLPST
jgi:hypothetical protein